MLNYSKYYSQINLYFHLFLETNFYRYSFLTNFTILKKNRVLGYNLFSRVKGFAPYALKKNILKINFNYLHSKTLSKQFVLNTNCLFDYFNFWSDSYKKYQDCTLKDLFISLNKKKKLKPLNISLDYTIMDNDIAKYNLNNYTDIIYIHKYDLLYSLNFNLFYKVKHQFYSKIWLLNYYLSLNSIYFNKILGNFYWNLNYDLIYFSYFFNFIKINCFTTSFNYLNNYLIFKYNYLNNLVTKKSSIILKNNNRLKMLNWSGWNKHFYKKFPLTISKKKRKRHLRYFFKKIKFTQSVRQKNYSLKFLKCNKFLVQKCLMNNFSKSLGNFSIKILNLYLKFSNLKKVFHKLFILWKTLKFNFKFISNLYNKKLKNLIYLINKQKFKINNLAKGFNKKIKKYNKLIQFFYSFINRLKKNKKIKKLKFLPYSKNRIYIKKISSYFFYFFKYIYIYFKKYLNKSWFLKSKILKYIALSIIKTLPKNLSTENLVYALKNNKLKIVSIISKVYKNFMPLKKKFKTWQLKKKIIIKKKKKKELNYKLYIKRRNYYHRIRSFKLPIKFTSKINFLIEKRAAARKNLHNNSLGLLQKKSWDHLKLLKKLKNLKLKDAKKYAKLIKKIKKNELNLELKNLMKLNNKDNQNFVVKTILKKTKHYYHNHFKVLKYLAKHLNIPFILEELLPPALLHSIEVLNNIDKYDIEFLPTYNGINKLKKGIINDRDKKLFKSTLCNNYVTRRVYFDIYKSKKSIYEFLGIDNIIFNLKKNNYGKIIKEYKDMYKQQKKPISNYFNISLKFNKFYLKKIQFLFGYKSVLKKKKIVSTFMNSAKILKNKGNNIYLDSLLKNKTYNNLFFKLLKNKGNNPLFFKLLKNKLNNKNFIKVLKTANPVIVKNFTEKFLEKKRVLLVKSKLDLTSWKLFGKIFSFFNNLKILHYNVIFKNTNLLNSTFLNINKYYSFIYLFFLRIFYKFKKFLIKIKTVKKFKGFSYSIKKSYKRFTYRLKFSFIKNLKLIKNKKIVANNIQLKSYTSFLKKKFKKEATPNVKKFKFNHKFYFIKKYKNLKKKINKRC